MLRTLRGSLLLRRIVAAVVLVIAAGLVYLAAHIPEAVSLPDDEVNKKAVAHFGEELRVNKPELEEGDAVLSYAGAPDETAEVWIDHASLTGASQQMLGSLLPAGTNSVVYAPTQNAQGTAGQHCRTAVVIRRAQGTAAPTALEFMQKDPGAGDQQFRQILVRSPGTALQVEVHTDSDVAGPEGLTQCPSSLKFGSASVELPAGPLFLRVPEDWVNLRVLSTDPNRPAWPDDQHPLNSVSVGEDGLKAKGVDVLSTSASKVPVLHVAAHRGTDAITLHDLKIAARRVGVDVGVENEKADAFADGKHFPVLSLPDVIEKNLVLSAIVGGLIAALLKWAHKMWFPGKEEQANTE